MIQPSTSAFVNARAASAYGRAVRPRADANMIVMLYDGAIGQLAHARAAILAGAIEERWRHVRKAVAIVEGLQGSLDHAAGGEVAALLDRFYDYVGMRLVQIDLRNDPGICDELMARLGEMRASWSAIAAGASVPSAQT
ncbi:MAG TPA: flagellar export chaperone FliS [Geminicoccaceae bacterium]|nr:flagellar export chaperone FliS [Geminicoccus sp.]HMU50751.1 flagellar export chaperone FliS [Geminicoccaceae bacterium]